MKMEKSTKKTAASVRHLNRALVGCILLAGLFAVQADSSKAVPVSDAVLEKVRAASGRTVARGDVVLGRLDGDAIDDAAVLHAAGRDKPYYLIILKGNSDGTFTKVYEKSAARCPECGGIKGRPPIFGIKNGTVKVDEMGGSRWAWAYEYYYRFNGSIFGLERLRSKTYDTLTGDVVDRKIHLNTGLERRRIKYGVRSPFKSNRNRKYDLNAYHLVSGGTKTKMKLDGRAGEAAWASAKTVRVTSGDLIYYGRSYRRGRKDLSFHIKSLYDAQYVYFFVDINDNQRVFGRRASVSTDHVELWFSSLTMGDDTILMNPKFNAARAVQFGLVPVTGGSRVLVRRWFPKNRPATGVEARYVKTRRGWSMEIRMPRSMAFRGNRSAVLFTAAVSDADSRSAGRRKSLMGTSRLSRRAPGHLGVLVRDNILNQGLSR